MKVVYNNIIPVKGYVAMMFFGVIFARNSSRPISARVVRHESIHHVQAKESGGYIPYYAAYLYWCVRRGYRNNPFEREAYENQNDPEYLTTREKFAWKRYKKP